MNEKAHPFEIAGMNRGPYEWVGFWSFPSPALAEQNPSAYQMALGDMPKLKNGCGTCANCGMAIRNICIVQDADGGVWGVGCDCVEKTGDKALGNPAKIAIAKHQAQLRREAADKKRAANHAAWLLKACLKWDAIAGETNADYDARMTQAHNRKIEEFQSAKKKASEILSPLADKLADGRGGFSDNIANGMREGFPPSGRALSITLEILAKSAGRRGSKAYEAEYEKLAEIFEEASAVQVK